MKLDLSGRVAIVTGASRGIGREVSLVLAGAGAKVAAVARGENAVETVAAVVAAGGEATALSADVSQAADVDAMVKSTIEKYGRVDILVCNAGINPHFGPMATASDEEYDAIMRINLRSPVQLANRIAPKMAARGGGSIILTSSLSGLRGNGKIGVYGLSKAALAQLARNLAVEFGPANVRANAISPGLIRTEFAAPILGNEAGLKTRLEKTPLRRVGEAREIAGAALFLASAAGAFVTGHNLVVDGGTLISD